MKKTITLRLCIVIILSMVATILLSYYIQAKSAKDAMYNYSLVMINQVSQIIEKNDVGIQELRENLKEDYFIRAKAAAYIVQKHPEVIGSQVEMKKIASLLQVDEFHLFNKEGLLYAGSESKYFGLTFNSGEQMQFFLPILDDYDLQLCQEVTPNTAEGKLMQYLAVWSEDRKNTLQKEMEQLRLLEAMANNELSHIFSLITAEEGITIFAADPMTGAVLGATDSSLYGKNIEDMGFELKNRSLYETGSIVETNQIKNYCVMRQAGQVLVGVSSTESKLQQSIPGNMALIMISLGFLSVIIILLIVGMLDKFIIRGIYKIMGGMKIIAAGDLDYRVEVTDTPEFVELSSGINNMVLSLLETTGKLSLVFQNVNLPIAVYEYNPDMKRVQATSRIREILMLTEDEMSGLLADRDAFAEKIQQICTRPFKQERDTYLLEADPPRYLRVKSYQEGHNTFGMIVDITEEMIEKQVIEHERDIDFLTDMLSRRAFFAEMASIFPKTEAPGRAMLLMVDLDNLKYVNDNWGHEYGDKLLCKTAELLNECIAPHKLVARLSGDEFVMIIYGAGSNEEMQTYLDDLYAKITQAAIEIPDNKMIPVQMSGGYVFYSEAEENYDEMLRLADQTMYKVKRDTKGRFEQYRPIETELLL